MKKTPRERSWSRKELLFLILAIVALAPVTYGLLYLLPGPKVLGAVLYKDGPPRHPGTECPAYYLSFFPNGDLDRVHFEIQFPEQIGDHRILATGFKNVANIPELNPETTNPLLIDEHCNFGAAQEPLADNIHVTWFDTPRSKIVLTAEHPDTIGGIFLIPRRLKPDPAKDFSIRGEYTYTKWGFSFTKKLEFTAADFENFKVVIDKSLKSP
jgi:hypothetical protein